MPIVASMAWALLDRTRSRCCRTWNAVDRCRARLDETTRKVFLTRHESLATHYHREDRQSVGARGRDTATHAFPPAAQHEREPEGTSVRSAQAGDHGRGHLRSPRGNPSRRTSIESGSGREPDAHP